ncbi:MAG: hypothetical protein DMD95_08460 [Candidatus Rokuibacteriota bacterium]|nr:MAG: hypothetical protein DMD95_08460 [Candidatus Rokubacteria bacterium]
MPASYLSPKTQVGESRIEGKGLFARRRIRKDEVVAIKGGHVYDARMLAKVKERVAVSYVQIADGFFIGALSAAEVRRNKMFINHSCTSNLGIRGQIMFVALRDIRTGEELTYDWAMEENRSDRTRCRCRSRRCRRVLTGRDWMIPRLQRRYRGYFSSYLEDKIRGIPPGLASRVERQS